MIEIAKKRVKTNLSLKVLSIVVLLSFLSDFVFIDYVSARSAVKKTRFDLMEEEPDTRRAGTAQPTMNQQAVDNKNALMALLANPQMVTIPSNVIVSDPANQHPEMNPLSHADMVAALNLVKDQDATYKITGNANLSDLVAQGKIQEGAKVIVDKNSVLTIDSVSDIKIGWIRVDGELKFSTDRNTQLNVGTLVVNDTGTLNIGSRDNRIQVDRTAKLIFADMGSIAEDASDPRQIGHGLIAMGEVHVFGAEATDNILPAAPLTKGSTSMTLTQPASGWKVGDEILLVSTANSQGWSVVDQTEKVKVSAISADGKTITFDKALTFDHVMPDGSSAPVAHMTHNVEFSSQNQIDITHQGHIMIMGWGEFEDASFRGLGRTTNGIVTDPAFDAQGNMVDINGRVISYDPHGNYVDAQGMIIVFDAQGNFVDAKGNTINSQGKLAMTDTQGKVVDAQGNQLVFTNSQGQTVDASNNVLTLDANGNYVDKNGNTEFYVRRLVENVRGRYALHFHRTGIDASAPVNLVKDCSLDAGDGAVVGRWGGVNHSSKVNFIDNVFNGFSGANLVGDEKGDALGFISGNITNKSVGSTDDFRLRGGHTQDNALGQIVEDIAHKGHGIYLQGGGGVPVVNNWVFGNGGAGIIYWRLGVTDGIKKPGTENNSSTQVLFPVASIHDLSVLNSLVPGSIITINGEEYVGVNVLPVYCIGNVVGASGDGITMSYNMGGTKSDEDKRASKGYSVIKDNIIFGVFSGIGLSYSSFINIENNYIIRDNPNAHQRSDFVSGCGIYGNNFTDSINMINNTIKGFESGISAPVNGLTIIKGGYLENVTNIDLSAPFHGDLALDVDPATTTRTTIIDTVRFGFYTEEAPFDPKPFSDIHLLGTDDNGRNPVGTYDYSAWDFARNPVIIRGENLDSLIVRMDYKGGMVSGANPNLYFYSDFVSNNFANNLNEYIAVMRGMYANPALFRAAPVNLQEGLNVLNMNVDGKSQQVIVFGDTHGPNFVSDPSMTLEIKAIDLAKGFDTVGRVVDQVGNLQFENLITQHFSNLVPDKDGIVRLQFNVKDRAGNISPITLELKVIQDVIPPVVQAIADNFKNLGYIADVTPDTSAPGTYNFSVHPASNVGPGRLVALTFSTNDLAKPDLGSLHAFFAPLDNPASVLSDVTRAISVDGAMLFASLSQLTNVDAFTAMANMVLQSADANSIRFDLGGNSLKITKDAQGIVTMTPIAYDVLLKIGQKYKIYGRAANDIERGDLMRQAIKEMKAGDTLMLGDGRFDCDAKTRGIVRFANNVTVVGQGADKTHLFSNSWSDDQGAAYQVRNGTFSDLTFENQSWQLNEDGRTIEMYDGFKMTPDNLHYLYENGHKVVEEANPGPFTATFDGVKFIGNAWVVYDWSGRGNTWIIRDCAIVGGRQGVSMMSGGGNYQNAYILRTTFDIDTMRSQDIGWTSNALVGGAYGVVARGGHITVEDCEFHIKGGQTPNRYSYAPRAVGIYDGNDFGSTSSEWTYLELINNRWFINGNGSPDTYDIFMTNHGTKDKLRVSGGYGSGPDGLITKNWSGELVPLPTPRIPSRIQAILDNLKAKFGATSYVGVHADPRAPNSYYFSIFAPAAQAGRALLLRFYTDSEGNIDTTKPMFAVFTPSNGSSASIDAKMLFAGLSQMSGVNPLDAAASMVLQSADANSIRFDLGTDHWKIYKDDQNRVILQKIMTPVNFAVSASPYGSAPDLLVSVDENYKATVTYAGQTHTGTYDEKTGQITINLDQNQPPSKWTLSISNGSSGLPFLSAFEQNQNGTNSRFEFNQAGLMIHSSWISGTNYSYDAYYTYVQIGDKNYIESMTQKGHSGYLYWLNASGDSTIAQPPLLPNGYSWFSKTFYAYDDKGNTTITVTTGTNQPDNGVATYSAYYSLSDGVKQVYVSANLDKDISELIHSAKDYSVIDQYAMFKTEYYNGYQMSLTYVKDETGIFVPRYVQTGNKAYIVQGQPDILFPDDTAKDIFILPWQNVNDYSVYYGAAYSYSGDFLIAGQQQTPKYLGYGLVFSKWAKKADGTYGQTTVVVDYPKTNKVALDGKLYQISINAQGVVQLGPVMIIDPIPGNWIQVQVANAVAENQEISVQYKLAQPATDGHHVHCFISAQPVTFETVKNISFDKVVMSFPGSDGQTGSASLSTQGVGTGDYYLSFWGVTKDHEYDGNGIVTRKITIKPAGAGGVAPMVSADSSAGISGGRRRAIEPMASRGKKKNKFNFDDATEGDVIQEG